MKKPTFKTFIDRIIEAKDKQDAIENVFYGTHYDANGNITEYGIDLAYQRECITYSEHQKLLKLIEKMA